MVPSVACSYQCQIGRKHATDGRCQPYVISSEAVFIPVVTANSLILDIITVDLHASQIQGFFSVPGTFG